LRGGLTAVGAERSSNDDRVPGDAALVGTRWTDDLVKVAKPLDEGSAGPIVVENFGTGLCNGWLSAEMMMMKSGKRQHCSFISLT
jgi:hypothetical protein